MKTEERIALEYVFAINNGDIAKLSDLMHEDHLFIDAHDNRIQGKDAMEQSWVGYFGMFPDYEIEVGEVLQKGSLICILGYASGTYLNLKNKQNINYWRIPAAWTAIVENNRIKQWQVYADNMKVMEIIDRNR